MTARLHRPSLVLTILGVAFLFLAGRAEAATFTVNTGADTPLSGAMCTGSEPCSLRAAVQSADAAGGSSTIAVPAGTYALTIPSTAAEDPANGDLDIDGNSSVTITGAGSGSTVVNAAGIDRAFAVQAGSALNISGMTIEGGVPAATSSGNQSGGAIWAGGNLEAGPDLVLTGNEAASGGGAFVGNAATASFTGVAVEQNRAFGTSGGGIAIETSGNVTLASSVLSENEARGGEENGGNFYVGSVSELHSTDTNYIDGTARYGGGVYIGYGATGVAVFSGGSISGNQAVNSGRGGGLYGETPLTLTKVTFENDTAGGRGGAIAIGAPMLLRITGSTFLDNSSEYSGAIDVGSYEPQTVIINSTFSGNSATQSGSVFGAYYFLGKMDLINSTVVGNLGPAPAMSNLAILEPYEFGVVNSIISGNEGGDCEIGLANDGGHNILGPSCEPEPEVSTDLVGVDPLLSPPAENGGGIETMALAATSPAIDGGDAAPCPATDQRGVTRAGGCDIGAFEYFVPAPQPEPIPTPTPGGEPAKGDSGSTTTPATAAPAGPGPSAARYKFGIKKIMHPRDGGKAMLRIRYNGPGLIQLSGKRVESVSRRTKAGVAYLPIVPNEELTTMLAERGRVHIVAMVQFTPDSGVGRIKEKKVGVWLYG